MKIYFYQDRNKKEPYNIWFYKLRDTQARIRIQKRISRIEEDGFLGDYKSVGDDLYELRFTFGPGYRVYFGFDGKDIILLLGGGDKKSQQKDIKIAKTRWQEYVSRRIDETVS